MSAADRAPILRVVPDLPEEPPSPELALRFFRVRAADGTDLVAWTNDVEGPAVLLCNGLGTSPYSWPALLDPHCGVRVISWNHRGTGGSERPADPAAVGIEEFVEDALAVLDHVGLDSAVVMGWSMGVNTAFELATLHPDRVDGLLAVAGVPGGTFSSMLAPLRVPRFARSALTVNAARLMRLIGRPASAITTRIPIGAAAVGLLSHSGFMLPVADPALTRLALREFLSTPVDWYMHMAVETSKHVRVSLRSIQVPTSFVAARWDLLAAATDMRTAAERIEGADYIELPGSHFVCMERPDEVHEHLLDLLDRVP